MKTLNDTQWRRVFLVNCEHTSNFTLTLDFERANVYWVHIEKTNTLEENIEYIMRYVVVI